MQSIKGFLSGDRTSRKEIKSKAQLKEALHSCKYLNPSETEREIIEATTTFVHLLSLTDVYFSNDGEEHRLVCLDGTIPVHYKGVKYHIPICIWLSQKHPSLPPLVQVKPTSTMTIKVGDQVDDAGMVSIPYLDEWEKQGNCDLVSLLQVLCAVFGENTPVYSLPRKDFPTKDDIPPKSSSPTPRRVEIRAKENELGHAVADKSASSPEEAKLKRAKLLLEVDDMLRSAEIIHGQAKEMIRVLKSSKEELIKGSLTDAQLKRIQVNKETTEEWLAKIKKEIKYTVENSKTVENDVKANNQSQIKRDSSNSYRDWSNSEVCRWFRNIGMEELADSVKDHNIRGVHLPNLAKEDLIELGAVKLGERMTIDDEINKLVNPVIDEI